MHYLQQNIAWFLAN